MALYSKTENAKIAATTTAQYAELETGARFVHLIASADTYISFDETVATTDSFLIKANLESVFEFPGGGPTKVWAITASTANVYLLAIR